MSSIDNQRTPNRKLLELGIFAHTLDLRATCTKQVTFLFLIFPSFGNYDTVIYQNFFANFDWNTCCHVADESKFM